MMKKLLTLAIATSLVMGLAACSGGTNNGKDTASAGDAQSIYSNHCASCHGDQLQGVVGPNMQKIGSQYSKAQILNIINNGKGGGKMPGGLISGSESDEVAAWLASKK